jgi:hypothetical protein
MAQEPVTTGPPLLEPELPPELLLLEEGGTASPLPLLELLLASGPASYGALTAAISPLQAESARVPNNVESKRVDRVMKNLQSRKERGVPPTVTHRGQVCCREDG